MANINIKRYNGDAWEIHYPKTTIGQVINLSSQLANMQSDIDDKAPKTHDHQADDIVDFDSRVLSLSPAGSRPASDVSAWAKKSSLAIGDIPTGTTGTTVALGNHTHSQYLTAHPTITMGTNTTTTSSPGYAGTFTAIDSITKDSNGHVTKINTKTVTMPSAQSIPSIPSVMTTTEGNTGTATTQRTINAKNLKAIILNHSPAGARTPTTHGHTISEITSLQSTLDSKIGNSGVQQITGGHGSTVLKLFYDEIPSRRSTLGLWASEPGVTYHGAGIGYNLTTMPHGTSYADGVIDTDYAASWIRFDRSEVTAGQRLTDGTLRFNTLLSPNGHILEDGLRVYSPNNKPSWSDIQSKPDVIIEGDSRLTNARPPTTHQHNATDINFGRFSRDRLPLGTAGTVLKGNDLLSPVWEFISWDEVQGKPTILPIDEGSEGLTTTAHTISAQNLVSIIQNISPPGARTPLSHTLNSHSGTLSLTKGGTGSTTASGARSNLGLSNVLRQVSFSGGTLTIEVV